ncbi:MAG: hypothetical protein AB7G37_16960, partial [Solirubrobacteraceae bacterium]
LVDATTDVRVAGYVAFLDAVEDPDAAIGVLALPVDAERLAALDVREANYARHDVTGALAAVDGTPLPGRTWVYRGTPGGRERARTGRREGSIVVGEAYVAAAREAFGAQPPGLPPFADTTAPVDIPVRPLRVVAATDQLGW